MKPLSIGVALFGLVALVVAATVKDVTSAVLGVTSLLCAFTTFRSTAISSFLKIFVGIFSTETIVFGLAVLAGKLRLWPDDFAEYLPSESLPLTVAIFSILVDLVARISVVQQITLIADRYFNATERAEARIWPFRPFTAMERRVAVAMVVFLVLVNQVEVGVTLRLSFFNRDMFNALQNKNAAEFWHQLLFVFTAVGIRLRRHGRHRVFRTVHAGDPLAALAHGSLRVALAFGTQPLPHQPRRPPDRQPRPAYSAEDDLLRFINGGTDGANTANGLYDFSILLIFTISTLVSFSIVLWDLSANFSLPGTDIKVPGFLFWVAFVYAAGGTWITHLLGRPLIHIFFERQHREADFRFSLVRLREYTEQSRALERGSRRARHCRPALRRAHRQFPCTRLSARAGHGIHGGVRTALDDHSIRADGLRFISSARSSSAS